VRLSQGVGLLALIVSLYILWQIRNVLLLIFAAIVFATTLNRIVQWLQQHGIKRNIATTLTVLGLLIVLAGFFAVIIPSFVSQLQQLVSLTPQVSDRLRDWLFQVQNFFPDRFSNIRNLSDLLFRLQNFILGWFGNIYKLFSNLSSAVLSTLFVLALTVMLLINPAPYRQGLIFLFPSFYRQRVDQILSKCETVLVGWIVGTLIDMAVIALVSFIGLSLLGVPLALVNALLAGLLEFIPNVGPVLSVIPPAAVALLDTPWKSIAVIILYILIQQFEAYLLVPYVMKDQASMLPAVTLSAVVVFGAFFGFLGVLLAMPLVIVSKVWLWELVVRDIMNDWDTAARTKTQKQLE
jgi:predicted PurR-regulated permease PerM